MKIIQILPELIGGGVERGTLELGQYLTEQGHESIVISNGGRMTKQLEQEGSRHIQLPVHKKSLSSLKQVRVLRELFEKEKADIIHLRSRVPAWLAWLAWRKMDASSRPRLVTTVHGFYSVNFYSKIMTRGERVICVSNGVKDYVLKNYPGTSEDKIHVIHRGVSNSSYPYGYQPEPDWLGKWNEKYPQLENKYIITLPGRITRWKGQLDFIEIISQLKSQGLPAHGLIVGEPHPRKMDFFNEVKNTLASAGLENDVTLTGHRNDLKEVLAVSDVVVSCSTDPEAFGRVTLEALTLGKPVAGYSHGGVAEQLSALLPAGKISVGNTNEMTKLLAAWHKQSPKPLHNSAFTLEQMLSKTLQVYEELAQSPR